ncbi:MAG: class I SAM-dependent methyltransferase [Bacteroidota bacterium]
MRFPNLLIAFCLCFFLLACDSDENPFDNRVDNSLVETEKQTEKEKPILGELDEKTGVQTPTIWHSPATLIERLGRLEDKTVANIGAGPYGYFSFQIADEARKVIAIDIDPNAIRFIDSMRIQLLPPSLQDRLETRLVGPDNPKLRFEEADIVTIRDTYAYLPARIAYLKNLKKGLKDGGKLLIVDFKMRQLPIGPPQSEKVPLYQVELDLVQAGYQIEWVDDKSLAYQYMLLARKG